MTLLLIRVSLELLYFLIRSSNKMSNLISSFQWSFFKQQQQGVSPKMNTEKQDDQHFTEFSKGNYY